MEYILGRQVLLRGYLNMPYAAYFRGSSDAMEITREELRILERTYEPCSQKVLEAEAQGWERLRRMGLIEPWREGRRVKAFQRYRRCDNTYMPAANWAITGKCNYNCLHCFNASDNQASHEEFSREEALKLVDCFDECGIVNITITGGEPTLHPNLTEVIHRMEERGLVLSELTTNGERITQAFLDELSGLPYKPLFKVSFDGLGHHDWLRNRAGSEERTIERIRLLVENGFPVQLQTSVHRKNIDSILPTARFFDEMGVPYMRIIRTSESPRWVQNGQAYTLSIPEYYRFALNFAEQYADTGGNMRIYLWQILSMKPKTRTYSHSNVHIHPLGYREDLPVCMHNKRRISITPSGEAIPCSQMSGWLKEKGIVFENVRRRPLAEILKESGYLKTVNYSVGELYAKAEESCGYKRVCLGGCRACAVLFGGQKLRPAPEEMAAAEEMAVGAAASS